MRRSKRLVRVAIDEELIGQVLFKKPSHKINVKGLPKRAKLERVMITPDIYGVQFIYSHRTFKEVKRGEMIPLKYLYYTRVTPTSHRVQLYKDKIVSKLKRVKDKWVN